ncbi:MAG: hypothetical protein IPJ03_17950 [Ignavibacteriales bacterium]|nr:hypothetical protein [Ignavibacteriales bacterium]
MEEPKTTEQNSNSERVAGYVDFGGQKKPNFTLTEIQDIERRKDRLAKKIIEGESSDVDIYNLCLLNKWTDESQSPT